MIAPPTVECPTAYAQFTQSAESRWTLTLAAATGVAVFVFALAEVTVNPRILQLDAFEVMGIAVRTNNAKEAGAGWRDSASCGSE